MSALEDMIGPPAQGTLPIGAVDARPGTKLYEIAKMQQQPAPQRQASQGRQAAEAQREQQRRQQVFSRLMSKAVQGSAQPGNGMVPFGALPTSVRQAAGQVFGGPVVGFDPAKLSPDERIMLQHLQAIGQQEVAQRAQQAEAAKQQQGPVAQQPMPQAGVGG